MALAAEHEPTTGDEEVGADIIDWPHPDRSVRVALKYSVMGPGWLRNGYERDVKRGTGFFAGLREKSD